MSNQMCGGKLAVFMTLCFIFLGTTSRAQRLGKEQLQDSILPSFSTYKDNYFITGVPLHTEISESTADINPDYALE